MLETSLGQQARGLPSPAVAGQSSPVSHPLRATVGALLLLAAAAALADVAMRQLAVPTRAIMWGALAVAALGYGLVCLLAAALPGGRVLSRWKFGPWMMIWFGTSYGLATLTWNQDSTLAGSQLEPSSVLKALCLVSVAVAMWLTGYLGAPRRVIRACAARTASALQRRYTAQVRGPRTPWILFGIGTAARVTTALTTGRLGYVGDAASAVSSATGYGQVIAILGLCAPLGLAVAALRVYRERAPARLTLVVLLTAELAYAAFSGDKQNYVVAALAIAIPYSAARRRLPAGTLIAAGLLFLLVVIPFTESYRSADRGAVTLTPAQAIQTAPGILRQTVGGQDGLAGLGRSVSYLLARDQDIDSPAIILQRTPGQIPFGSPVDLIDAPLQALIPRALWPGKPILATGYAFGQQYFGIPATVYSSTTITPIGDLYRHGGLAAVLIGMLVFGGLVRMLDDGLDPAGNPHAILLVLLMFPSLVMSEQDWITLMAGMPAEILLWLIVVPIAFRRRAPATPARTC